MFYLWAYINISPGCSVSHWRLNSTLQIISSIVFPTFKQTEIILYHFALLLKWPCEDVMSLCHFWHRRLNFTGKSSYFFTVFSLVGNTYTAMPPPSLPWENQHHLNIHTLWFKCQVFLSVWRTLNIVDGCVVTSDSLYNCLGALPDGWLPVFLYAVPVWHFKRLFIFKNVRNDLRRKGNNSNERKCLSE